MVALRLFCVASCLATVSVAQGQTSLLDLGGNLIHQAVSKLVSKIEAKIDSADSYGNVPKNDFDSCIYDTEKIDVCSPKGKTIDLLVCLIKAKQPNGYYANSYTRLVNFPPDSFTVYPSVTMTIKSCGRSVLGGVQVRAENVSSTGFALVVTGGQPVPPYDLKVKWYACVTEDPAPVNGDYTETAAGYDVTSNP